MDRARGLNGAALASFVIGEGRAFADFFLNRVQKYGEGADPRFSRWCCINEYAICEIALRWEW